MKNKYTNKVVIFLLLLLVNFSVFANGREVGIKAEDAILTAACTAWDSKQYHVRRAKLMADEQYLPFLEAVQGIAKLKIYLHQVKGLLLNKTLDAEGYVEARLTTYQSATSRNLKIKLKQNNFPVELNGFDPNSQIEMQIPLLECKILEVFFESSAPEHSITRERGVGVAR